MRVHGTAQVVWATMRLHYNFNFEYSENLQVLNPTRFCLVSLLIDYF